MRLMEKPRMIAFYLAALASLTAIVMIPFYEHWYSVKETKVAWSALSSPELHVWLLCGTWAATFALVASLFGQGIQRIIAFVLSVAELYFWLVLSIAV